MELTATEYRVAEFVARGYSEKEIADKLFVSTNTIHNHTYNIRKKLKARNAVDIARKFILSIDNPRKYFAAVMFLVIQFHLILNCDLIEMRRTSKRLYRTHKIVRKN